MLATRKVTVSLPEELVEFADSRANERRTTRSGVITDLLDAARRRDLDALAKEGYRFFARESEEFAEASGPAVAEALDDDRSQR